MLEAHRDPHEKLVVLTVETGLLAEILETTRSSYGCCIDPRVAVSTRSAQLIRPPYRKLGLPEIPGRGISELRRAGRHSLLFESYPTELD